jgi:hypothetical protein
MEAESSKHFATPKACDFQGFATEILDNPFFLSAILSKAAPSAPPMWGRRSLQSRQAQAKRRRSLRVASMSMPSASRALTPSELRSYALSLPFGTADSHPSALNRS